MAGRLEQRRSGTPPATRRQYLSLLLLVVVVVVFISRCIYIYIYMYMHMCPLPAIDSPRAASTSCVFLVRTE